MNYTKDRTWAEIDLESIAHNYKIIREHIPEQCRFLAAVKADAYGHGSLPISRLLQELGADYLAVATLSEAIELREGNITVPILIFGGTHPSRTGELIRYGLTQTVYDADLARAFSREAKALGRALKIHLKIDSGMGRLGLDSIDGLIGAMALPYLDIEGIFTHFAVSDEEEGGAYTRAQFNTFTSLVSELQAITRHSFGIRHCACSGAVINYPYTHLNMVRPGIALYGAYSGILPKDFSLKPAMELKTRISQIKLLEPGASVSYGRTYTATERRRIAVIPIGYADGLLRTLSGRMDVLVGGVRAKQIGRICMDMCMIDITDIPHVSAGDVVTIFGKDGDGFISVNEQARAADTISYELLCSVSRRVPRLYIAAD